MNKKDIEIENLKKRIKTLEIINNAQKKIIENIPKVKEVVIKTVGSNDVLNALISSGVEKWEGYQKALNLLKKAK